MYKQFEEDLSPLPNWVRPCRHSRNTVRNSSSPQTSNFKSLFRDKKCNFSHNTRQSVKLYF